MADRLDLRTSDEKAADARAARRFAREEARHVSLLAATLLAGTVETADEAGKLATKIYHEALAWAKKRGGDQ